VVRGDVLDAASVAGLAAESEGLVSAISSGFLKGTPEYGVYVAAARSLADGVARVGPRAPRVILVGGAGSLLVGSGVRVVDLPDFPEQFRAEALAQAEGLEFWRGVEEVDWTYISPAGTIEPGERTGRYRRGGDQLLVDESGASTISMEDYAVGLVDELEHPAVHRARITLAY
jgi:putative NADH-flavin reductase